MVPVALGTALAGGGAETRSSGHLSLPHSWGPPDTVNDLSAAAPWLSLPLLRVTWAGAAAAAPCPD